MNYKDYIDFNQIAEDNGMNCDYDLIHELCDIVPANKGVNIIMAFGKSNGRHGNDPSYSSHTVYYVLNDNLEEIETYEELA